MERPSFLLCFILFLTAAAVAIGGRSEVALVGGWKPIKDLNDPHVKEIAVFAVSEYDKQSKANLKFESVVKGETQVVSGTNYRLVLAVKDSAITKDYEAVVWEKPWAKIRNLTSFKPVQG